MQRAIRVRREAVKLVKSTRGTGRNLVVTWQIIGPSKERQRLIDKGMEAGFLFCTKTKLHGMEGKRNGQESGSHLADYRAIQRAPKADR
jgi:hypothetical protein